MRQRELNSALSNGGHTTVDIDRIRTDLTKPILMRNNVGNRKVEILG